MIIPKTALALLAGLTLAAAPAGAQAPAGDEIVLKPGDPAPALSVETWVKGEPVAGFQPGKFYVVEFWATWCGPCIQTMPHLSQLQAQYREKGLTIIGMTSADERGNTLERVKEMVADKGDTMAYTVAWDKGQETNDAYMKAAQQRGIPCSFVVNGSGTIAYIGHPVWLDLVLAQVVAGTWDPAKGGEVIAAAEEQLRGISEAAGSDPEKALERVDAFVEEYPSLAGMLNTLRFSLLLDLGRLDEGYAFGREIVTEAMKEKDVGTLLNVAARIVDPEQPLERLDLELAGKAARMANELTEGEEPWALMTLARVHSLKGEHEQAIALQEKAIGLIENPGMKEHFQGVLDELKAAAGE